MPITLNGLESIRHRTTRGSAETIYLLCDVLATLEVMLSIRQDLWLHDGHDTVLQNSTRRIISNRHQLHSTLSMVSSVTRSTKGFRPHLLADACVASQDVGVLHDSQL